MHGNIGKKHSESAKTKMRLAKIGKKYTENHKLKISQGNMGKKMSVEAKKKMSQTKKGKKFTEEHRRNLKIAHKGQNAGHLSKFWKGGITPLRRKIRTTFEYRLWRSDIFTRDNYTCILCGDHTCKGKGQTIQLNADHFPKTFSEIIEQYQIKTLDEAIKCSELWNINNGRTLCEDCHKRTPTYGGKNKKSINHFVL